MADKTPENFHSGSIDQILDELLVNRNENLKVGMILDLDSTLFSVSPRSFQIFKEFVRLPEILKEFSDFCQTVENWHAFDEVYEPIRFLEYNLGIECPQGLRILLKNHWAERFFQGAYLKFDSPYPGALEFVSKVHAAGIPIYYLTGRDSPNMKDGTLDSLAKYKFPLPVTNSNPTVQLIMKDHFSTPDMKFKEVELRRLSEKYDRSVFIDNEPENLFLCKSHFSNIRPLLFKSVHSGRLDYSPEEIESISHW